VSSGLHFPASTPACLQPGVKTDILISAELTRRLYQSLPPRIEKLSHEASSDSSLP
jgi:hypothetical protein